MGGEDKGLLSLNGKPLTRHIIDRLHPQVASIVISANRNIESYREFGYPVIEDAIGGFAGPLAGVLSAMQTIRTDYLLTVPCDTPMLPLNLVERLLEELNRSEKAIVVIHDGERLQPAHVLLPVSLRSDLETWLSSGGNKVREWLAGHGYAIADFSDETDAFANINTRSELENF